MLPPEILDKICTNLCFNDILSLCKVVRLSESTLRNSLLKFRPWYELKYSQWDTWGDCALNYGKECKSEFSTDLKCAVYTDVPLPDDFKQLCNDRIIGEDFVYTNNGFFFRNESFNLSQSCDKDPLSPTTFLQNSLGALSVSDSGPVLKQKSSSELTAVVIRDSSDSLKVKLKDKLGVEVEFSLMAKRLQTFCLQIIGKMAYLTYAGEPWTPCRMATARMSTYSDKIEKYEWSYPSSQAPAGLLFYDGCLFDVFMTKSKVPLVPLTFRSCFGVKLWYLNKDHFVEQDSQDTNYGVIYDGNGLISGLVDLKAQSTKSLAWPLRNYPTASSNECDYRNWYEDQFDEELDQFPKQAYLKCVGFSNGTLGVWRFSLEYLQSLHKLPDDLISLFITNEEKERIEMCETLCNSCQEFADAVQERIRRESWYEQKKAYHDNFEETDY